MSLVNRIYSTVSKSVLRRSYVPTPLRLSRHQIEFHPSIHPPRINGISFVRHLTTNASPENIEKDEKPKDKDDETHSIIRNTEKPIGDSHKHEFQAETRMLLDIVARSLYSENEVFVRELISNASDALEKFRYTIHTAGEMEKDYEAPDRPLEIHIATNKQEMQLIIQDTGIGMTKEEIINNLGTIARSGSKMFLEQIKNKGAESVNSSNIIGQFGVGFYSSFMVSNKVEVFTKSSKKDSPGYRWIADGSGSYEIQEADGVAFGTKIIIHLKPECREYADEERIKAVIRKYSNFVGSSIYVNGKRANEIQPIWLLDPKEVTADKYNEFYNFIATPYGNPRFILHYKADVPVSIRALFYFPLSKPELFDLSRDGEAGVALYTRKVLIQPKTSNLLPKFLRFIKGVVDSEDIPLNLSRELLQNSALIRKISNVLTNRIIRFLQERSTKEPTEYADFYKDYGIFLKEGIVTSRDASEKEEIAKLLLFDSSKKSAEMPRISLVEYCKRIGDQKDIYYLSAPNRILAESSPYYEGLKKKNVEVLFCYDPYDELVLMQMSQFAGKNLISVEKEMRQDRSAENMDNLDDNALMRSEINEILPWIKEKLKGKAASVKITNRLDSHPCVVTVEEMAAARHFIRTQGQDVPPENRFALLQPQFDINPKHPIIKKLYSLKTSNPELAELLTKQLFNNALVGAGLADDPRLILTNMNDLLTKVLEKY